MAKFAPEPCRRNDHIWRSRVCHGEHDAGVPRGLHGSAYSSPREPSRSQCTEGCTHVLHLCKPKGCKSDVSAAHLNVIDLYGVRVGREQRRASLVPVETVQTCTVPAIWSENTLWCRTLTSLLCDALCYSKHRRTTARHPIDVLLPNDAERSDSTQQSTTRGSGASRCHTCDLVMSGCLRDYQADTSAPDLSITSFPSMYSCAPSSLSM